MWLVAIVMDTAFLNTTKVNVQQLKMHLIKQESFLPYDPAKRPGSHNYLFKKNLFLIHSLRPVMIYCHPIRQEKIRQFNVTLRCPFIYSQGCSLRFPLKLFLAYCKPKPTSFSPSLVVSLTGQT